MNNTLIAIWSIFGCTETPPSSSMAPPVMIRGSLKNFNPTDCDMDIKVDLIQTGEDKPIYLTEVNSNGTFQLHVPERPADIPLHVYGFCYSSTADLEADVPTWSTEPYLLLSTHDPSSPIELIKATVTRSEPPVSNSLVLNQFSTEYNVWSQNPLLIEYYGIRHPKQEVSSSGSVPEIRQGGLSTKTQLTHIFAIISYLQSNSDPFLQELLLPSQMDLDELNADLPPTSVKLQIVRGILQNACGALDVPCPSINHFRQQEWILKDKSSVFNPTLTQIRAELWFKGHHCIQQLLRKKKEIPASIPVPADLLTIQNRAESVVFHQRWDAIYEEYNLKPFPLTAVP